MPNVSQIKTGISLLRWQGGKFLPKGKIDPKALGYVCPNGEINFATENTAIQYTKNKCMKAAQNGYELGGFRHKNRILLEKKGDADCVDFGRHVDVPEGTEVFHSHVGENANPVSLQDYICIMDEPKISSIIAYDSKGAYSKLSKTAEAYQDEVETIVVKDKGLKQFLRQIFDKPKIFTGLISKRFRLKQECENDFLDKVIGKELRERLEQIDKQLTFIERGKIKCTPEEFNRLQKEQSDLLRTAQSSNVGKQRIHKFWNENDYKYGVEYSTDFLHLNK